MIVVPVEKNFYYRGPGTCGIDARVQQTYPDPMRRSPRMDLAQWAKTNANMDRPWATEARCGWFLDLPWISDTTPLPEDVEAMRAICESCPVRSKCARFATASENNRGVAGGFYAGVWVPWVNNASETENTRLIRTRARATLRELALQAQSATEA